MLCPLLLARPESDRKRAAWTPPATNGAMDIDLPRVKDDKDASAWAMLRACSLLLTKIWLTVNYLLRVN